MFIAIVLTMAFSGANGRQPEGYDPADPVRITAWAPQGTSFVNGMLAALQILFTWVSARYRVSDAIIAPRRILC